MLTDQVVTFDENGMISICRARREFRRIGDRSLQSDLLARTD
jgi:hypothetical protein